MNPQPAIFLAGFVVILLGFIFFIAKVSGRLSGKISQRRYDLVERVIIAGIFLGIVGMFQPWMHAAYRAGFLVLLFSTLAFIVWSHVTPQTTRRNEEIGPVSVSDLETSSGDRTA
jgi:hypothetical membrane protein